MSLAGLAAVSCAPPTATSSDEAPSVTAAPTVAATSGPRVEAAARFQRSARPVAGSYIVQLAADAAAESVEATADALLAQYGGTRTAVFTRALRGFAARMPEAAARRLSDDARVHHVEENALSQATQVFGSGDTTLPADATGTTVSTSPVDAISSWALDRIDQRALPPIVNGAPQFDGRYNLRGTGDGVHVYVIDSAYLLDQADVYWLSRLQGAGVTFLSQTGPYDCAGHGTMMGSIIAGRVAGVARNAILHPVRVLDCNNETDLTRLLQAADWVAANAVKPAVVNMSISGPASSAWNAAIANLVNVTGILVVGAAGNGTYDGTSWSIADACTTSPASEPTTLTVGSASGFDQRSAFSNYGSCVDIFAPGTSTDAANFTINGGGVTLLTRQRASGTSVSTALVTGAAALYLERFPTATPTQVRAALLDNATTTALDTSTLGTGSPNRLLYTAFIPYGSQNTSGQELGVDYVANGNFESGATGWTVSGSGNSVGTGTQNRPAYSGTKRLEMGGVGTAAVDLTGARTAPYSPAHYVVRFRLRVTASSTSISSGACGNDHLYVRARYSPSNVDTFINAGIYTGCMASYNGATTDEYRDQWVDLGTNSLVGTYNASLQFDRDTSTSGTTFLIDDVRVVRATPSASGAWAPISNANFELGNDGSWGITRASGSAIVAGGGGTYGSWSGLIGGWSDNVAHHDELRHVFTIPADSVETQITIPVAITTSETTTSAVDTMAIEIRDANTSTLYGTLGTLSNRSASGNYTYSLDAWVGRSVRLWFNGNTNANNLATSFKIDNITLARRTWTSPVLP